MAIEAALLRQLRNVKAKSVYISTNKNHNQRGSATVYFESQTDRDRALKSPVYYYNNKMEWAISNLAYNQLTMEKDKRSRSKTRSDNGTELSLKWPRVNNIVK